MFQLQLQGSFYNASEFQNTSSHHREVPGDLPGHLVPAIWWFIAGFLYLIFALKHFYDCKLQNLKFKASVEIPYRCSGITIKPFFNIKSLPVTAWAKLILGNVYFDLDVFVSHFQRMNTKHQLPHLQHDTIAFCFIMSGLVDLLCVWPYTRRLLPMGVDYVFFSLTFFTEALQFVTHLHGRIPVDVRLHQLQATVAAMTVLILAAEVCFRKRSEFPVIRALLMLLQATWMFHVMSGLVPLMSVSIDDFDPVPPDGPTVVGSPLRQERGASVLALHLACHTARLFWADRQPGLRLALHVCHQDQAAEEVT
ncbi:transmembrane protein 45B [Elysia marginata]|uniref:Transmembrane protein 45B n=1 Tax=Elysia marginata TaxID=1093978 RepID=A0AAV4GFB7_9GAST|nr:transmembrane protein 45B [Elysia marginata]